MRHAATHPPGKGTQAARARRRARGTGLLAACAGLVGLSLGLLATTPVRGDEPPGLVLREFVYEDAPTPQCHASTLAEADDGTLVAAWFGGTKEGAPDVGIWVSRRESGGWTVPREVAGGVQYLLPDGTPHRHPCWNPVLVPRPGGGLDLYYKVGPSPRDWWGMRRTSLDGGRAFGPPQRLPEGILGPVKNRAEWLDDRTLLCGSSTEHDGWRVHFELLTIGKGDDVWTRVGPIGPATGADAIQPALLRHGDGRVQALCRSRQGVILSTTSADGGRSWSPLEPVPLPNPNSGIDAVTLRDGRHLVVYNHTPRGRSPLNVALSADGAAWQPGVTLESEPGEYSYPAVIAGRDGRVHITYTWRRQRIRHVVLDPAALGRGESPPAP